MAYRLEIDRVGQRVRTGGYVTTLRHVLVGGSDPASIETKMGFTPGSLHAGYWLLILAPQSRIGPDGFEFRGYTHLTDGVAKGATQNAHQSLMAGYAENAADKQSRASVISAAVKRLNAVGIDRVAKVYPVRADRMDYAPGTGVPQYVLSKPQAFDVMAKVMTGMHLVASGPGQVTAQAFKG